MGAGAGFDYLAQAGVENAQHKSAYKQQLKDEELQGKIQDLIGQRSALVSKISTLDQGTPEYQQAFDALKQVNTGLVDVYHPQKNPGAIQKFGHLLTDHLGIKVGGETLPERRQDKADALAATKDKAATTQTQQQVAGAPLSPAQMSIAEVNAKVKWIDSSNLSSEDKAEAKRKLFGVAEKPTLKLYASPDGSTKAWLDASRPDTIPVGWTAYASTSADANKRADYEAFKKTNPQYQGTFEQWNAEQAGLGRNAAVAAKPPNRDDRYIAILQKGKEGKPLTQDDIAYKGAYDLWVQKTKVDPGVARMAALNNDRYTWVYDLNDPDKNLHPMRMGDAAKAPVGSPQNIAFKTDTAITRAFTSGAPATTINYFNTAIEHLNILKQAVDALNNGNIQVFNKYANAWATATGNPAPNNFDTVRNAVAGELSKTFKGTGATDEEIGLISGSINNTQSPDQLYGGIDYDLRLMQGKMEALKGQYEAGKQGRPNFPGAPSATPQTSTRPKGAIGTVPHAGKNYWVDAQGNNLGQAKNEVAP